MNIKYNQTLTLIEELQKLGTLDRIIHYGPIETLRALLSRVFNNEVYEYFENYLESLDDAIMHLNSTNYKVNIDRYTLGELYNVTKLDPETIDAEKFFIKFFNGLNLIVLEIVKAGIDELFDNGFKLENINSLRGLTNIKYNSETYSYIQNIISEYYVTIANKPFNIINLFSYLKRFRLDTNFISSTVKKLEKDVINYIKLKYSVNQGSVFSIYHQ